ncbi:hypothetical protein W02_24870 [Nitrospira sp. KM1]|uniref:hypothetical protein n=1 Tax=Nitrospira sp. KM1 TaxID=1936990 RepID=UPI0013A771DD|nr:hypothetical protein [Nitrospira sp. KM1]BCA55347.1 hypothetical protein W02_24870 [Nitrospira sp. KM1]
MLTALVLLLFAYGPEYLFSLPSETTDLHPDDPLQYRKTIDDDRSALAKKYPGDVGIEHDPAVVFVERFDRNSVDDLEQDWSEIRNVSIGMTLVDDPAPHARDSKALKLSAIGGQTWGADLYKMLPQNYNELFIRYYVKYAHDGIYTHAGVLMGGLNPPKLSHPRFCCHWPEGDSAFSVGFEIFDQFMLDFYLYWVEMKRWGEIVTPVQKEIDPSTSMLKAKASGNTMMKNSRPRVAPGKWYAVEFGVKVNEPFSARNGQLRLWIDGVPVAHYEEGHPRGTWTGDSFTPEVTAQGTFEGFRWRTAPELALNWVWLLHYVPYRNPAGHVSQIWYDNVVVAQKYIGPISP